MRVPIQLIDAFTSRAFAGNPAAVCLLTEWRSDRWLQQVAAEMNQAETAFLVREGQGFRLRWFTPVVEVDLCGHATLASAHLLWTSGVAGEEQALEFFTRSGKLVATRAGELIELDFPMLPEWPIEAPPELLRALGVSATYVGQSRHDVIVEVATEAEVRGAKPDFAALARLLSRGVILTARSRDPRFDFVSRFFAPAAGIPEDPVTGSAHCCLVAFWGPRLGKSAFRAFQASPRGGVVHARFAGDRAILGGQAVTTLRGELLVDEEAGAS